MADVNRDAYNLYNKYDEISYELIKYLKENNEMVWKLLLYKNADAWSKSNLTSDQKQALIYEGSDDSTLFNVFLDDGNPDVLTREDCIIRISPIVVMPDNHVVGEVTIAFEVYSHYKMNTLSNYKTRVDTIVNEFLETFNGINIDGVIGRLYFDGLGSRNVKIEQSGQTPFKGKKILMATKMG